MVLEPIYEHRFAEHSYGFRPGRSCHDALRRVSGQLADGYTHVVDIDIQGYFDTIDQERLMKLAIVSNEAAEGVSCPWCVRRVNISGVRLRRIMHSYFVESWKNPRTPIFEDLIGAACPAKTASVRVSH